VASTEAYFLGLRATLRNPRMLLQLLLRPLFSICWTSTLLKVSESGRGLPALDSERLDVLVMVAVDSHGNGSCMARKPETKHPP
jgi:hypothetical protein